MGRPEQRRRKRKQAAESCQKIDSLFAPAAKRSAKEKDSGDCRGTGSSTAVESHGKEPVTQSEGSGASDVCQVEAASLPVDSDPSGGSDDPQVATPDGDRPAPACRPTSALHVDIGDFVDSCSSEDDVGHALRNLPSEQKYALLRKHWQPSKEFKFPTTYMGGCNRSFRQVWLHDHPWMAYSGKLDGGFCIPCALFPAGGRYGKSGKFLTRPFRKWNKKSEQCGGHQKLAYHGESMKMADDFVRQFENPETQLPNRMDEKRAANIEQNRSIVKVITEAVLYCGRQCLALRGDHEDIAGAGNPGNLIALLKLLARHNDILRQHLESPAMRNAKYISHRTQDEIIEVLGQHMILKDIVDEIKQARFYAILADEITSHNHEYLALCVRFVAADNTVREDFLAFLKLDRITGEEIAATIIKFLNDHGIPLAGMRGQGYDGAANMSSDRVGVQKRIRDLAPHATYVHCHCHSLNLVITKSCALPEIRNVTDKLQHCCRFFLNSPKRGGALQLIVNANVTDTQKRKPLLDLCRTRWAERHTAYQHFYQAYTFIVQTLEMIGYGRHTDKYGDKYGQWDTGNKSEAQQILASITHSGFIVGFMCIYNYLSHLSGITVKLQKRSLDIVQAYGMILEIKEAYARERQDVETQFHKLYQQCERMAEVVGNPITMPRITGRQQHRSNQASSTPEEYYRKAIANEFLDHIISALEDRFSRPALVATSLLSLVPSVLCTREAPLDAIAEEYEGDLPSPELLDTEVRRWKSRYDQMPDDLRPTSPGEAIQDCDGDMFPNIAVLLRIACTIPVTSCECERSASALRRLHDYKRASMSSERMSRLALLHVHYDTPVDLDRAVTLFAQLHPRRLELEPIRILQPGD